MVGKDYDGKKIPPAIRPRGIRITKERLTMKLTANQKLVLYLVADHRPYAGCHMQRAAVLGRSITLESLSRKGLVRLDENQLWFLTDKGKDVLSR